MQEALPKLTSSEYLAEFGAPASQLLLDAVASRIRTECGWHIAPRITETVILDSIGSTSISLPTLHLVGVSAVRVWDGTQMVPLRGWDARTGWSPLSCSINHSAGFPVGARILEVDMIHGFEDCPEDLLRVIAALSKPRIVQEALSGHSVTLANSGDAWGVESTLERYRLGPRP